MVTLSVPHELSTTERQAIIAHSQHLRKSGAQESEWMYFSCTLPDRPLLFVKHSNDNVEEAATQNFFYHLSLNDPLAPRIPRVFDAFNSDKGESVVVMEYINAPTLEDAGISEEEAVEHAASAVGWLLKQLPSVPDTCFGRISENSDTQAVTHRFFKDHEAPGVFSNAHQLAQYISKASQILPCERRASPETVLGWFAEHPGLGIYHSDIQKRNFLLQPSGRVCIIDFQHIGVFPCIFQTFAFFNRSEPFASAVGKALGYRPSDAANKLSPISSLLVLCGLARLGMFDKKGRFICSEPQELASTTTQA